MFVRYLLSVGGGLSVSVCGYSSTQSTRSHAVVLGDRVTAGWAMEPDSGVSLPRGCEPLANVVCLGEVRGEHES